ncbi:tyrosine/phenylalanine carboxypeptidase domain-containing protein [candidate division KSB1 bacterium]
MPGKKNILKDADKTLYDISRKISFLAVNPINESREKKRFFSERNYEPQFKYAPYMTDITKAIDKLSAIKTNRSYMGQIFKQKKEKHINRFLMLKSRGTEDFTKYSIKVYGRPNKMLVRKAKRMMSYEKSKKTEKLTPKEVMEVLKEALRLYGFNWDVKQKNMAANAAVQQAKRNVLVKKGKKFSHDFIKRLIVHEIGTHVLRYENGLMQPYRIFATGFPGYLETEEGLAVVNEEKAGVLSKSTLKTYAGRAIAVSMAQEKSFREIYKYMRNYFSKDIAWRIAVRAKRGIGDTSQPGGLTKDYQYLNGYFKVKNYLKKYSMNNLYYGKVSMRHAKMLGKIKDLVEPKYLPK